MKHTLNNISRLLLVVAAIGLVVVIFVPIWRIDLDAPQYPEGLSLTIHANGLKGNVDIINGLNHYIGMKSLHNEDFFEFTILPYCIIGFAAAFLLVALANRRKWLNILFVLFLCFGIVAMIDFWKWEYNYGHNLNPDAAIIVPGMAYQPPLIGFKQLLNFGAYSIPAIGGWIFIGAGITLLSLVVLEWKFFKKKSGLSNFYKTSVAVILLVSTGSCNSGSEAILTGKDNCSFCKMTVSDNRFGAEIITKKGKVYKFDDAHCILSWAQSNSFDRSQAAAYYFTDFSNDHSLIKAGQAMFLKSDSLRSPMQGNIAAFSNISDLNVVMKQYSGTVLHWNDLLKP
ncbi:MAG: nitrous oxide reductase accessory protein NosL [Bacteroidota bacterium]